MIHRSRFARGTAMNAQTTIRLTLAAAVGITLATVSPASSQTTLGGAKNQQNKIGGVAKPAPVVGGAVAHTPSSPPPPKPAVVNTVKPIGTLAPSTTASAGLSQTPGPRPNPPVTPPKPGSAVVTSNLKCANGACTTRGPKP
jgi:hypothetical protein